MLYIAPVSINFLQFKQGQTIAVFLLLKEENLLKKYQDMVKEISSQQQEELQGFDRLDKTVWTVS